MKGSYLLRGIPENLWLEAQKKAIKSDRTMRWILIELLKRYVGPLPEERPETPQ